MQARFVWAIEPHCRIFPHTGLGVKAYLQENHNNVFYSLGKEVI